MILNNESGSPATAIPSGIEENKRSSKLVRLVVDPEIKCSIKLDELSTTYDNNGNIMQHMGAQNTTDGVLYPMIRINDVVLNTQDIRYMSIDSSDLLPTISLIISTTNTTFMSKSMPKDGDIISVYMQTDTDSLQYIRCDFIISGFNTVPNANVQTNTLSLSGRLFIPRFDSDINCFAKIGTSKDVLKHIAKKFKIGFAYNDADDTADRQNWICSGALEEFIEEVLEHTWKNETSFFKAWIDVYYNLCFVNVNKFLLSTENDENEIDITFFTNTVNYTQAAKKSRSSENDLPTLKILSNASTYKGSPFFIKEWAPYNSSSEISMNMGYEIKTYTYLHNQKIFDNNVENCFEELSNIPAYDQAKKDSYILLRGRARYDKSKNPEYEQERVNHDYIDAYISYMWTGVEYVASDTSNTTSNNSWDGNVHENYNRAKYHNAINLAELDKLYISVTVDGLCLQIMRGERIPVYLLYNTPLEPMVNSQNDPDPGRLNKFYCGYYIVDAITFTYMPSNDAYSNFSTTMILKRREWPAPEDTQKTTDL